jgi:hypothetical protein
MYSRAELRQMTRDMLKSLAGRRDASQVLLEMIYEVASEDPTVFDEICKIIALNPNISVKVGMAILHSPVAAGKVQIAMNRAAPAALFREILSLRNEYLLWFMADNTGLPKALIWELAELVGVTPQGFVEPQVSACWVGRIRSNLAMNEAAPEELLSLLASDPDPSVRVHVLHNRFLPARVVEALTRDEDPGVSWLASKVYRSRQLSRDITVVQMVPNIQEYHEPRL